MTTFLTFAPRYQQRHDGSFTLSLFHPKGTSVWTRTLFKTLRNDNREFVKWFRKQFPDKSISVRPWGGNIADNNHYVAFDLSEEDLAFIKLKYPQIIIDPDT
jgi:hypothetical protein